MPIDASPSLPVLLFALGDVVHDRSGLRYRSRLDGDTSRSDRSAARSQPLHRPCGLAPKEDTRRVSGGAVAGASVGGGAADRCAAESRESELRIRTGPAPRGEHESQAGGLPARAIVPLIQAHPRFASPTFPASLRWLCACTHRRTRGWGSGVWVDGHPAPGPRDDNSSAWNRVTPEYFEVIGTPILKGRGIADARHGDVATRRRHQ